MPCLNEARTIRVCIEKAYQALGQLGITGEVIIADNGSADGSVEIALAHRARVVSIREKGYGSAVQGGIAAARGRYVIMGDADDSYDFCNLEPFIKRLRAGDDLVVGNRFQGGIRAGAMPWHHRYIGNPILSGILNLFFHTPIRDAHCGLRGFRKDAYSRLNLVSTGMEFASEMVVKAALHGQKMCEVPTVLYPDGRDRRPHLRSFRDGWRHLRFLILMCPQWLFLFPAYVLMGTGLALMAWLTPGTRVVGGVGFDVHSMLLGSLCMTLGHQTLWFWAFAKLDGWLSGLLPGKNPSIGWFNHLTLERGLGVGLLFVMIGLGLNLWLCLKWWNADLGSLHVQETLRIALWGSTMMILGVQAIFGSFFLSILRMNKRREP
jgi:hypothetical protein